MSVSEKAVEAGWREYAQRYKASKDGRIFPDDLRRIYLAIQAADDNRNRLVACVELAARTFRRYEELHRAKGTADGDTKAESNAELAATMEAALTADDVQETE